MDNKQYSTRGSLSMMDTVIIKDRHVMKKDLILSHESMSPEIPGISKKVDFWSFWIFFARDASLRHRLAVILVQYYVVLTTLPSVDKKNHDMGMR